MEKQWTGMVLDYSQFSMVLVNLIYLYKYVLALTCLKGQYRGVFACICNTFEGQQSQMKT